MSVVMEVSKENETPVLVMKKEFNAMDFSEKIKCLVEIRTAIEKEICFTERDMGKFIRRRRFKK
jgi:hypothetical protein|tara:strand:- start:264 stop:455 length:192 start_codon:yes stop_codon:yes gene_type:complete